MGNIIKDGSGSYLPMLFILPLAGLAELASLYSIQALLPKLSEVYHIPLNQVGMILSAEVGFLAFAMLFSGSLSDRFGRKPVIFASLFAGGVLTLLCALAPSWQVLVIFRALLKRSLRVWPGSSPVILSLAILWEVCQGGLLRPR